MNDDPRLHQSREPVLGEMLARNARRNPTRTALWFQGTTRTYAELDERANRLAHALEGHGVGAGDRVAILMYNGLEVVESLFACVKLGAIAVPVNFRLSQDEARYILGHSGSAGIVVGPQLDSFAREVVADTGQFLISCDPAAPADESYERALAEALNTSPTVLVKDTDVAVLMYTSGTTGLPKGAMLTHRNLLSNTVNWLLEMGADSDDVWLSGLPLFHIGGINGLLPFLYLGTTAVVTPSTGFDARETIELITDLDVTMCFFVPTQWQEICAAATEMQVTLPRLRVGLWGASQAPRATLEALARTFPHLGVVNAFGQTEMSSNTCFLKPADALRKMGSVGRPAVNVDARIVDEDMSDVPLGEIGEIIYRGPTVMKGYYNDPGATAEAFTGGWFHSGDLVVMDADGYITVVDRKKDMIISGGENIYPAELERVIRTHPNVIDVAVIGVPHDKWVETPVAVVVCSRPTDESELIALVRSQLASYKKPRAVVVIDELPRNAAGKVLKRNLKERFGDMFSVSQA